MESQKATIMFRTESSSSSGQLQFLKKTKQVKTDFLSSTFGSVSVSEGADDLPDAVL